MALYLHRELSPSSVGFLHPFVVFPEPLIAELSLNDTRSAVIRAILGFPLPPALVIASTMEIESSLFRVQSPTRLSFCRERLAQSNVDKRGGVCGIFVIHVFE